MNRIGDVCVLQMWEKCITLIFDCNMNRSSPAGLLIIYQTYSTHISYRKREVLSRFPSQSYFTDDLPVIIFNSHQSSDLPTNVQTPSPVAQPIGLPDIIPYTVPKRKEIPKVLADFVPGH